MHLNRRSLTARILRNRLVRPAMAGSLVILLSAGPAWANVSQDASNLLKNGRPAEAMNMVDGALKQNPKDAQLRFLKGVILSEQNRATEAIGVFTKLTEDYPNLPEPYNNLAVLYAAGNQFEKARIALDKAIRTNPSYATAYENLGDVHAKLASQAYDKALQLDSGNAGAKSKLTMVKSLVASATPGQSLGNASTAGTPAAPAPTAASRPASATQPPQRAVSEHSKPPASVSVEKAQPADEPKHGASRNESRKPAPTEDREERAERADRDAVLALVNQWAKAWSAKDVKSYLNFYGKDFVPPKGMTRKSWADEREARIAGKGRITVKVESPQVSFKGTTATVKFRQSYESDRLTANSRKTLVLSKQGGRWQIQQELTGG